MDNAIDFAVGLPSDKYWLMVKRIAICKFNLVSTASKSEGYKATSNLEVSKKSTSSLEDSKGRMLGHARYLDTH